MGATVEKPDAWMPFYVGDYLRDTGDLSLEEHGAYSRLLLYMWGRDGRLPLEHARLARLVGAELVAWERIWPELERFFDVVEADGRRWITQRRLERELQLAKRRRAEAVENGRAGAEARKARQREQATLVATLPAPLEATPVATPLATPTAEGQRPSSSSPSPSPSPSDPPSPERNARAGDPRATEPGPGGVHHPGHHRAQMRRIVEEPPDLEASTSSQSRPTAGSLWTPQRLTDTYGRLRSDILGGLPWAAAGQKLWEKAAQVARAIEDDPEAAADVEPTMRLQLERARDSQDPRDGETTFGFGAWVARFTDLREELRGIRRSGERNEPCGFHREGNEGRPAPKHLVSEKCAECRHVKARASPRPAAAPSRVGDVIGAANRR
jgi:uncharacterized protein YdaU (DUF1376 family)